MKKWLAGISITTLIMIVGSIGLAVNDDGGSSGGVYTKRTANEMQRLLQEYRARRDAPHLIVSGETPSPVPITQGALLTEEQEMLQLQQLSYEAQLAQQQRNRSITSR